MAETDWSKFYKTSIEENNDNIHNEETEDNTTKTEEKEETKNRDEVYELSTNDYKEFCNRLTGLLPSGETKAVISYQTYICNEDEEKNTDPQKEIIYEVNNAITEISFDELNPGLTMVSIRFKSFDDPELRLLWARIQKWRTTMSQPQKDNGIPLFLLHLLERESIGEMDKDKEYTILDVDIINPLMCYITREVPTMEALDIVNEKDEHMGGNVIKLLCNTDFVTFSVRRDIDTVAIKAEVEREIEEEMDKLIKIAKMREIILHYFTHLFLFLLPQLHCISSISSVLVNDVSIMLFGGIDVLMA